MTEASIILLLCILIKSLDFSDWTLLFRHTFLGCFHLFEVDFQCIKKIECPLEIEPPRQMLYFIVHCSAFDIKSEIFSKQKNLAFLRKKVFLSIVGWYSKSCTPAVGSDTVSYLQQQNSVWHFFVASVIFLFVYHMFSAHPHGGDLIGVHYKLKFCYVIFRYNRFDGEMLHLQQVIAL